MGNQDSSKFILLPYEASKLFTKSIFDKLFHVEVVGVENIPQKGPAILICNHTDYIDSLVQAMYIPRKINFLAKKEIIEFMSKFQTSLLEDPKFKKISEYLFKNLKFLSQWIEAQLEDWGANFIDRTYHKKAPRKISLDYYKGIYNNFASILNKGQLISIFPEGRRSKNGLIHPFTSMASKLALKSGTPIIPSGINGAWKFSTLENFLTGRAFRTKIQYQIGKAITKEDFPSYGTSKHAEKKAINELNLILKKEVYQLTLAKKI